MKKIMPRLFSFLLISLGILFFRNALAAGWTDGITAISTANTGLPEESIYNIVVTLMKWLLGLLTVIAVISFIITGIMFIMSGSNPDLRDRAKSGVVYSIIGLVIALSGYIIINVIAGIIGGNINV